MLRRILLPLEPSIHGQNAQEIALRIALERQASVTALVVVDEPAVQRQIGSVPAGGGAFVAELRAGRMGEIQAGLDKMVAAFESKAAGLGVAYEICKGTGDPSETIVQEAAFHDLIVMGQRSDFDFDGESDPSRRYVQAVLDKGVSPVLILPSKLPEQRPERILVLFNGSLPSARALHRLPMMPWIHESRVRVVMADTDEAAASPALAKAAAFLKAHGIPKVTVEWTPDSVLDLLKGESMEWADMVVAGAHARSVLDFLLGSVASFLIEQDKRPVLICG